MERLWVAHRGWQHRFPENTLIAIDQAIAAGATAVEVDLQLTADLEPVLCHDRDLKRLSGQSGNITALSWAEVQQRSAAEPGRFDQQFRHNPFCHLTDCLSLLAKHPQVTLYLELKRHSLDAHGRDTVLTTLLPFLAPIADRCVIISFDLRVLERLRELGWAQLGLVLSNWRDWQQQRVQDLHPQCLFVDHLLLPSIDAIRSCSYPLVVYEVADYPLAEVLFEAGAKGVETFAIGEMLAAQQAAGYSAGSPA